MHEIEPYYNWLNYYDSSEDENSPYFGKEYNYNLYSETIYNYYIDPAWDFMGSDTLYIKILYVDYIRNFIIIELIGEWNDAINNDIMHLKRNIIDHFTYLGIEKFIILGDNVYNFHGSDDCYYEEWFEDIEQGWIAAVNFREYILEEWQKYNIDYYINCGGSLQFSNWRTFTPETFFMKIEELITRRIDLL